MIHFLSTFPGGMRTPTKYIVMHNKFGISEEEFNVLNEKFERRMDKTFS